MVSSINQNAYSSALPNFRNLGILLRILLIVNLAAVAAAMMESKGAHDFWQRLLDVMTVVQPLLMANGTDAVTRERRSLRTGVLARGQALVDASAAGCVRASLNVERRWLDGTRSFWVELGPEELGGVHVNPDTIAFNLIDRFAPDAISRVTFSNMAADHFAWREEKSLDEGRTWTEFVTIEAHRTQ